MPPDLPKPLPLLTRGVLPQNFACARSVSLAVGEEADRDRERPDAEIVLRPFAGLVEPRYDFVIEFFLEGANDNEEQSDDNEERYNSRLTRLSSLTAEVA